MRLEITDLRTIRDDTPSGRTLEFRSGSVTIGSHSESLVQLPDVDVAAHHATIERTGDAWIYRPMTRDDRQTRINDRPANGDVPLKDGDVLVVTHFEIRVSIEPEGREVEVTQVGRLGELALIKQYPIPPRSTVRRTDEKVSLAGPRQKAIADLAMQFRGCRDLPSLMESTLKFLEAELAARMVWFGARKNPTGPIEFMDARLDGAVSMAEPPKLETFSYRCLNRQQHISIPRTGDGVTQSVVAVPILAGPDAIGLLYVDSSRRTRVYDDSDLDFVTLVAGLVRPLLEMFLKSAQGLLGAQESTSHPAPAAGNWSLVHQLRDKVEPKKLPQWPTLELAHYDIRGKERAVDVLDAIRMPNGLAAVLLGRVMGDPARVAMAISEIRGAFRVAGLHADPPRIQLRAMNWLLSDKEHPCSFDASIAVINPKSGAFEISTAGRVGAFVIASGGQAKSFVLAESPAVGNGQVIEYKGQTSKIAPGESILLFTAGAADARNADGEKLGSKRLVETLCDGLGLAAEAALDELVGDLGAFLAVDQQEDATILLAHRPA